MTNWTKNFVSLANIDLTPGDRYDIITSRGRIEAHVTHSHVAIFAADYARQRWHGRVENIILGHIFDGGIVESITLRDNDA